MNPSIVRTLFRVVAIAEAISWLMLLTAMLCKWVLETEPFGLVEGGVPVAGPIHGGIFVAYVVMCVVAHFTFKWNVKTALLALVSAIPPFMTLWFELKADRDGLLGRATAPATS